jgi:streptogramin lyase
MRVAVRGLAVCLLCGVGFAGLDSAPGVALAEGSPALDGSGGSALESPLVVAEAQPLVGGEGVSAAEEARRDSPEAVAAREASRTAFASLDSAQAAKVDSEALPRLLDDPAGGPPQLPSGESISAYLSGDAAEVSMPGGNTGIVESMVPFARETAPGHFAPLDLAPNSAGEGWEPTSPLVGVRIAKRIAGGVALPAAGVSLRPVDAQGTALAGGEGAANGAGVLFANTLTDSDTLVKASTYGFALETILRSVASPQQLYFRVGMPQGASLAQSEANGPVRVVKEGKTVAEILPVSAHDATGLVIPTSAAVSGDTLDVTVDDQSAKYQFPATVDPEFVQTSDSQFPTESTKSMWEYRTYNGKETTFAKRSTSEYLESYAAGSYSASEWGAWIYETQGESKIWELTSESEAKNVGGHIESKLEISSTGGKEEEQELSSEAKKTAEYTKKTDEPPLCAKAEGKRDCAAGAGQGGNAVWFVQSAAAAGSKFSDRLYNATVQIAEPKPFHSEPSFNTGTEELHFKEESGGKEVEVSRKNALYRSGGWLGKSEGALELEAADKGIGVAATQLEYENAGKWEVLTSHNYYEKGLCKGVQCYDPRIPAEYWTLNEVLPNGEDKIRYRAEEKIGPETRAESEATVKVAKTPPRHVVINGLPYGNELSERAYELTTEATDGEGTTVPSPGIKAIEGEGLSAVKGLALFVDGHEAKEVGKQVGCSVPKGECKATAKWTINGAELGAGHHAIVIVAKDRAGNEARIARQITVRHSTPVALGPGSVDLQSGDFSLGSTDVSQGSGLTVSRNYSSRDTTQGDEGPFGPEWSLSLGSNESLVELVDGSVLMTGANGSQTIFAKTETTAYESPPGDSNLTLTVEENKEKTQKLAYYLADAADHSSVKFTLPVGGTKVWVPTRQEGAVATDTVTEAYQTVEGQSEYGLPSESRPQGITQGPEGNLWYTDFETSKIGKITTSGVVSEYALPTGSHPYGITQGADGNLWFTDDGTSKIGKITTSGTIIAEYKLPKSSDPTGITLGPDNNVWFTDSESHKIGKITPAGEITEYSLGTKGNCEGIAQGPNETLWWFGFEGEVGKITTSGAYTEYALPAGSRPRGIAEGPEGNMWYTVYNTGKVGKITPAGEETEYTLPKGAEPYEMADGPEGDLWYSEWETAKIGKITPAGTSSEYTLPNDPMGITVGPDGEMWYTASRASKIGKIPASGTITEPTEALAPVPAGVSCTWKEKPTEMQPGCRALEFKYANETTAKGEAESEWGEYKRRLTKVLAVAYNPAADHEKMEEIPVAEYSYDKLGRLRAEWNPRTSPALKTTYGYDAEGHVTALTPAGLEPWAFTYGPTQGDTGTGRLLKAMRAQPATGASEEEISKKLKEQAEQETNTEAPKLTGSPLVGVKMSVSNGKWSGSPVTYGYQWKDCNTAGEDCVPIAGATNASYTGAVSDVGHTVVAQVTATNITGSATATSVASHIANTIETAEYALASGAHPYGITAGPDGNLWATDSGTGKVDTITTAGVITEHSSPETSEPRDITTGADKNLWYIEREIGYVNHMTTSGTPSHFFLSRENSGGVGITAGPDENLWFTEVETGYVGKINTKSEVLGEYALPSGSKPYGITVGSDKNLWVADYGTNYIDKMNTKGEIVGEYKLPSGSEPYSIAAGPDKNLWFTDYGTNKIGKITTSGTITEYTLPPGSEPRGIAAGPDENLWFTDYGTNKIGRITTSGAITEVYLPSGSEPDEITAGPDKNVWFTEYGTNNIGVVKLTAKGTEGEATSPAPGATIDYNVPLEGAGAPHQMGANETTQKPEPEKWGQSDDPVEATALFPPDEPQSWPASGYKRATVYYLDEQGRQVNVATPSTSAYGTITTTEYNEYNDVTRTLTADNRATALAAGEENSAATAGLLSTENRYNEPECQNEQPGEVAEPGTRLCETFGPQHEIRLQRPDGHGESEVLARNHEEFFYNQGVPKEKPYNEETFNLVTETADLAKLANKEEQEVRTTKTAYAGLSSTGVKNAGWKLREPTSVTVEPRSKESNPNGLSLTRTTIYNETTGQVEETRGTAAEQTLTFTKTVSATGTEPGKLKDPSGIAIDSKGDVWVADTANNRIEEFSAEGTYLGKFGEAGSEPGKLKEPKGLAFDSKGDLWVADTANNRIEEYNPTEGKYLGELGSTGSEKGQLKGPTAIAFDASGNLWVADTGNNRVEKYSVTEGKATSEFGGAGSEPGKLKEPAGIAISEGNVWVADTGNNRIQEFSSGGTPLKHFASEGTGEGQLKAPAGLAIDASGNVWTTDELNGRVEGFTASGAYLSQFGWKGTGHGQLNEPHAIAGDAHGNMWIADSANNRIATFSPGPNAHDQKTIYYSAAPNETYTTCGKHPEWAGLVCQTRPAKQPELAALPQLPVTTTSYNMWLEPEKIEESFTHYNSEGKEETAVRTRSEKYSEAGEMTNSETKATGSSDKSLPTGGVSIEYNKANGLVAKQSTSEGTITNEYDRLGRLIKYTEAAGNTATYKYAELQAGGQLQEVSDSHEELHEAKERHSFQRYSYNETTSQLEKLEDSAAGTFTASYDAEGKMTSETYPNGMCAKYAYNPVGEATSLQYVDTTNCSASEPLLYSDTRVASIHGETLQQTSTLASETYTYDPAGRLTEVQETPAGEGCIVRAYAYDEESNRASLTTRKPGSKNECQTEGGTTEAHNYDEANRLTDTGTVYEPFGDVEKLPAADAEGHELTTTYYVDGAVASQSQNGVSHEYKLDPEGRITETTSSGKKLTSHYDGPGEAVSWTSEEEGKKATRNIPGIDGTLSAVQTNNETPELQLHDLQGDIIATIGDTTSETKLKTTYNATEFGAPNKGKTPPKYAWLGAGDVADELASGVITYGATSYVPQDARALQAEQVIPPGLPDGSGVGTPVTFEVQPWVIGDLNQVGAEAPGREAGREHEAFDQALAAAEDPIVNYRAWEAKEKSAKLLKLAAAGDLVEELRTLFGSLADWIDGVVEAVVGTEVAFTWLEEYGQFLEACVRELHAAHASHGGCSADYKDMFWEGSPLADFWSKPVISYCLVGKYETHAPSGLGLSQCWQLAYQEEISKFEA